MIRRDPKDFVLTAGGDAEYLAAVRGLYGKGKQAGTLEFKKHFYLERGPYEIVAVVDENADTEPFVLEGKFIDLFDPALPVLTRRAVLPGTQALLYNLDKVADPGRPQVLACAACVETERVGRNGYSFMVKGPAQTTNVMRVLDQKKIPYTAHTYDPESGIDGVSVARSLGQDPASVFKTLVARGASGGYYVFDIPVAATLDLKKAAHAVGEKSVAMLPQKELLPLTGYVHGGCSPVGMKKLFPTVFHETAASLPVIMVSAGKLGHQIACDPKALLALVRADTADIITEE